MSKRSVGIEYWSGVESDFVVENVGHMFTSRKTENNRICQTDCSFNPGHISRCE